MMLAEVLNIIYLIFPFRGEIKVKVEFWQKYLQILFYLVLKIIVHTAGQVDPLPVRWIAEFVNILLFIFQDIMYWLVTYTSNDAALGRLCKVVKIYDIIIYKK